MYCRHEVAFPRYVSSVKRVALYLKMLCSTSYRQRVGFSTVGSIACDMSFHMRLSVKPFTARHTDEGLFPGMLQRVNQETGFLSILWFTTDNTYKWSLTTVQSVVLFQKEYSWESFAANAAFVWFFMLTMTKPYMLIQTTLRCKEFHARRTCKWPSHNMHFHMFFKDCYCYRKWFPTCDAFVRSIARMLSFVILQSHLSRKSFIT